MANSLSIFKLFSNITDTPQPHSNKYDVWLPLKFFVIATTDCLYYFTVKPT